MFVFRVVMPAIFLLGGLCISKFTGGAPESVQQEPLMLLASLYNNNTADTALPDVLYELGSSEYTITPQTRRYLTCCMNSAPVSIQ